MRTPRILLAVVFPPLAVALTTGLSRTFWVNVGFTVFGFWLLGAVHAYGVVIRCEDDDRYHLILPPERTVALNNDRFRRQRGGTSGKSQAPSTHNEPLPWPEWNTNGHTNGKRPTR